MSADQEDKLLWSTTMKQRAIPALVAAIVGLSFMISLIFGGTARPDKQIHGYGWLWYGLLMVGIVLLVQFSMWVTIEIRRSGFYIKYGPFKWPRQRIPWSRVERVQKVQVRPREWGGYGYRLGAIRSLAKKQKGAGLILGRGEGLQFDLANNRVFVCSLDGAAKALDVIDSLLNPAAYHNRKHGH